MYEPIDMSDIVPIEIPVKNLMGKDYVLREANGAAATVYFNIILSSQSVDSSGRKMHGGLAGIETTMLSHCLFEVNGKGESSVPQEVIDRWPARVKKRLYEKLKEVSELMSRGRDEKEELKKALAIEGAPVPFGGLQSWVLQLSDPDDKYKALKEWFKEDEDSLKNERSGTTAG